MRSECKDSAHLVESRALMSEMSPETSSCQRRCQYTRQPTATTTSYLARAVEAAAVAGGHTAFRSGGGSFINRAAVRNRREPGGELHERGFADLVRDPLARLESLFCFLQRHGLRIRPRPLLMCDNCSA